MGRWYLEKAPDWIWKTRRISDVRGWIAWTFEDPWEGKRAFLQWAEIKRMTEKRFYVKRYHIVAVMKTIEMKRRLRLRGFL